MALHDVKFKLDSGKETDRKVGAVLKRTKTSNAFFWIVNNEDIPLHYWQCTNSGLHAKLKLWRLHTAACLPVCFVTSSSVDRSCY